MVHDPAGTILTPVRFTHRQISDTVFSAFSSACFPWDLTGLGTPVGPSSGSLPSLVLRPVFCPLAEDPLDWHQRIQFSFPIWDLSFFAVSYAVFG